MKMEQVNSTRLYYKILYVSDLTTMDGKTIIQVHTNPTRETLSRRSKLPWPQQQRPGTPAMKEWSKAMEAISSKTLRLSNPLGKWYENLDSRWLCRITPGSPTTLERTEGEVTTKHPLCGGGFRKIFCAQGIPGPRSAGTVPAPTIETEEALYVRGEIDATDPLQAPRTEHDGRDTWQNYFIENATFHTRENELSLQLQTQGSRVLLVTDGGANRESGYYGWVIASEDSILITGTGRLACAASQLQSLRPETTSYLACTTFLRHYLQNRHHQISARVDHYVDNMTVVRRMMKFNTQEVQSLSYMLSPDMDIQLQVQDNLGELFKNHHFSIQTLHVKGHQDKEKRKLQWEETLNIMADKLADESKDSPKPKETPVPAQVISLWSQGHMLTTQIKHQMREKWSMQGNYPLIEFLCNKYKWEEKHISMIDCAALPKEKTGVNKRAFISSFTHQWLPLNERLQRREATGTSLCPMCDEETEDDLHLVLQRIPVREHTPNHKGDC